MEGPSQRALGTQRPHMRSGGAGAVVGCAKTDTDQQLGEDARKRVHAPSSRFLEDVPPNMGSIKFECLNSTESHWIQKESHSMAIGCNHESRLPFDQAAPVCGSFTAPGRGMLSGWLRSYVAALRARSP